MLDRKNRSGLLSDDRCCCCCSSRLRKIGDGLGLGQTRSRSSWCDGWRIGFRHQSQNLCLLVDESNIRMGVFLTGSAHGSAFISSINGLFK